MAHGRVSTKMASLAAGKSRRFLDLGGGTQDSAAAFPALSGALSGQGVSGDLELRGLPRRRSVLVSIASILYRQFSLLVALRKWGQAEIQPFNVFATLGVGLLRLGGVCARFVFANPPRTDFFAYLFGPARRTLLHMSRQLFLPRALLPGLVCVPADFH